MSQIYHISIRSTYTYYCVVYTMHPQYTLHPTIKCLLFKNLDKNACPVIGHIMRIPALWLVSSVHPILAILTAQFRPNGEHRIWAETRKHRFRLTVEGWRECAESVYGSWPIISRHDAVNYCITYVYIISYNILTHSWETHSNNNAV